MKTNFALLALSLHLAILPATAGTYTVTNLKDSGKGSLRAALTAANADPNSSVVFTTKGAIPLRSALPDISAKVNIDGTSAPGYSGSPVIQIAFGGNPGLFLTSAAKGSVISGLSLTGAGNFAIKLQASNVAVQNNYIGLRPDGSAEGNFGDGVRIQSDSRENLIGNVNAVTGIDYYDTSNASEFSVQPVTAWQGIRNYLSADGTDTGDFLICGSSNTDGLLYIGPIDGGGDSYTVNFPGNATIATSVYGPSNAGGGKISLVGTYRKTGTAQFNLGFVWQGTPDQLPSGGNFQTISYPNATYQFVHSTMNGLAVGNADGPALDGKLPLGAGKAYIYSIATKTFLTNIVFPGSKSNTAYGIWYNGDNIYTICGGYSPIVTSNLEGENTPLTQGKAFLVDYNAATGKFSNWTSFDYPNGPKGVNFVTHFEGISSAQPGVYTLNADSVESGSSGAPQGSWVTVLRNPDTTFDRGTWVDLDYPGTGGVTSSNSVYGNFVVGLVIDSDNLAYQAEVNVGFQLSNVISSNGGNGVVVNGSNNNVVAMNYIGTDASGSPARGFGNSGNGILVTNGAKRNLIGGVVFGVNNPTGNKDPSNAVFQRPAQGNLISGNTANGVLINQSASDNILCGNFIGTDDSGLTATPNGIDGVAIENAPRNSLLGCTFFQNPFVYYNVISGNQRHGLRVSSSNGTVVQANFLGMGADNATSVPNGGNGLLVDGNSRDTLVGGPIPLGNVISGNRRNGIQVRDRVAGFTSYNTFAGIAAFQQFASPNGENGILITATGGDNLIRTSLLSGNERNGIEISGDASGVTISDSTVGTNTATTTAIPNQQHGIVFSGSAHDNVVGTTEPSILPTVFVSGNKGYGIVVTGNAHKNRIIGTNVGLGKREDNIILPNGRGGILLDRGSSGTILGSHKSALQNVVQANQGVGIYLYYTKNNNIFRNAVTKNTSTGIYAFGDCEGTSITNNSVTKNGTKGKDNVNLSNATGITFTP